MLSKGSRIAIGIVALVSALFFLLSALDPDSPFPGGPLAFYGLAILCVVIAIACIFPKSHPVTLRIIGTTIFVAYTSYLVHSFGSPGFFRALAGMFVFGIPSGYLAIFGKSPTWDAIAKDFKAKEDKDTSDRDEDKL